jgi:hypothetical protein
VPAEIAVNLVDNVLVHSVHNCDPYVKTAENLELGRAIRVVPLFLRNQFVHDP